MQKVTLRLEVHEWEALVDFALHEHRPLQYQAEYIVRQALEQNGFLKNDSVEPQPNREELSHVQA